MYNFFGYPGRITRKDKKKIKNAARKKIFCNLCNLPEYFSNIRIEVLPHKKYRVGLIYSSKNKRRYNLNHILSLINNYKYYCKGNCYINYKNYFASVRDTGESIQGT